nr:hypothetical protein CFP56_04021 [Quercus suber]
MALTIMALYVALALLMVDSIIELALISSMVSWLHQRAGRDFEVNDLASTFPLHGKPENLLLNQGHTSNGAAGTAFVLIGIGGFLALWLRSHSNFRSSKITGIWYHFWLVMTLLSMLLTLSALIYTFVITAAHRNQSIDVALASSLDNHPYPNFVAYPKDAWTPENWFSAVLQLDLPLASDRDDIRQHLVLMRGWRWNLIPMFLLGLAVCGLAVINALARRKADARGVKGSEYAVVTQKVDS